MSRKDKNVGKKIAISTAVAGVVGYLTGVLTAPQKGKYTREDIAEKAGEVKEDTVDQLQDLSVELKDMLRITKTKTIALSSQAREDFNEAVVKAKDAQDKATTVLKAIKAGKADDPELNKAIKQAKQAQKNLAKFLKNDE